MSTTPAGAFLRRERQEKGLLLGDVSKMLNISTPYLSQIETGQRQIPDALEDKVISAFGLSDFEANEFRRAAALSRSEFSIHVNRDASFEDRSLAHDLAESFARLSPDAKDEIRRALGEKRNG